MQNANQVIEAIKDDILGIVSNFIELKKSGVNYSACCPFHDEKTPSFMVNPSKGIFKCFGCDKGGNAIEFIKQHECVDFKDAVEIGAKKLNISFQWKKAFTFDEAKHKHRESLLIACNLVERFFAENLKDAKAQDYIKERNIELQTNFNLGYAPNGNSLLAYAKKNGVKTQILEEIGLLKSNENGTYDFFRDRLIFPISNMVGQTIAFAGRDISGQSKAKYLNTHESCIYKKSEHLYALNIARFSAKNEDRIYIVEGYTDALRLHFIGISVSTPKN